MEILSWKEGVGHSSEMWLFGFWMHPFQILCRALWASSTILQIPLLKWGCLLSNHYPIKGVSLLCSHCNSPAYIKLRQLRPAAPQGEHSLLVTSRLRLLETKIKNKSKRLKSNCWPHLPLSRCDSEMQSWGVFSLLQKASVSGSNKGETAESEMKRQPLLKDPSALLPPLFSREDPS